MKKTVIATVVLAALAALFLSSSSEKVERSAQHRTELFDRIWIEKMPTSPKQKVDVFVALREMGHFGVFEKVSAYEGSYSVFEWKKRDKGQLDIKLLQTDKTATLKYKVGHDGCGEFDYCLELKGAPMGGKRYGSMKGWEIKSTDHEAIRARVFETVR